MSPISGLSGIVPLRRGPICAMILFPNVTPRQPASGPDPMLRTARLPVDGAWQKLLARMPQRLRAGLSRFARWATLRRIAPKAVDDATLDRFIAELDRATLVRELGYLRRKVARTW